MAHSRWITDWADDPDGGGGGEWRTQTRDAILAHSENCRSLDQVWLPRSKGVTCPSDWFGCEDCGIWFANEVTYGYVENATEDAYPYPDCFPFGYFCDCCWRKRNDTEL